MATRFWFRFEGERGMGTCESCSGRGPVNRLCLRCCVLRGMELGICFACNREGPFEEACHWCDDGRYLNSDYGICPSCEWLGTIGVQCGMCGDALFEAVPHDSGNDSDSRLIIVMVPQEAAPDNPETDSDSTDSEPEEPVADRTRSHAAVV